MKYYILIVLAWSLTIFSQEVAIPETVGISSSRLERLNNAMQNYVQQKNTPGLTMAIARKGKLVYLKSHGTTAFDNDTLVDEHTIFRIYSMSKVITSAAIMILYEEGYFQLYDPVSKFIPEFKNLEVFVEETEEGIQTEKMKREPTIRDLITHTAGFTYGYFGNTPVDIMYQKAEILDIHQTTQQKIEALAKIPLKHQPGSTWEYSISIDILGHIVEVISGKGFDQFLQEKLFTPLEMVDTGFFVPQQKLSRFVTLYHTENGQKQILEPQNSNFHKKPTFLSGGGGMVSTITDYLNFSTMLLNKGRFKNKQIIGKKTAELMMRNHLSPELLPFGTSRPLWGYGFGLGGAVLENPAQAYILGSEGEFSWAGLANTFFLVDPKEDMIAILFTQSLPHYRRIGADFRVLLYQALVE